MKAQFIQRLKEFDPLFYMSESFSYWSKHSATERYLNQQMKSLDCPYSITELLQALSVQTAPSNKTIGIKQWLDSLPE